MNTNSTTNYAQIDQMLNYIQEFAKSFEDPKKAQDTIHASLSLEFAMMLKNEFNRGSIALMDDTTMVFAVDAENNMRAGSKHYVWVDGNGCIYGVYGCWNDPRLADAEDYPDYVDPSDCEEELIFLNIACNKINKDMVTRFVNEAMRYLYE